MSFVSSLKLHNVRCYKDTALGDLGSGLIVLYGANGAGKTNVLEAVSLLVPGRGLRSCRAPEVQCVHAPLPWAIAAKIRHEYGEAQIGTGLDAKTEKRLVRINGESAGAQSALAEHMSCIWLTPQMDRLFLDSSRERRKFLDRMIFSFDPGHSGRVTRYENAMRQRSRLLGGDRPADPAWLDGLEVQMAETGVAIAAARLEFVERLQVVCEELDHEYFPRARLTATGTVEELLGRVKALEAEEMFAYQLRESRGVDMRTGGAATGPHKSDLDVMYAAKTMKAAQCSTGEQKALLIGIILAHAKLIAGEHGAPPVLLLDEVAAHLDETRRAALYGLLTDLGGQVWLTGTDRGLFADIEGQAQFFEVKESEIHVA